MEFWRNGLGVWLPSSMPYYVSAIDMSPLLNMRSFQVALSHTILLFEAVFVFLCYFRPFRVPFLLLGVAFHLGITLSFNIYPFGLGMLAHYALLVPFAGWRRLGCSVRAARPRLTVFYDELCPLCNRTVIVLDHFDIFGTIAFKGLQTAAGNYRPLDAIADKELLKDLYALDRAERIYAGLDTYIQVFAKMIYTAPLAWTLRLPGVFQYAQARYRRIADQRVRAACDESCAVAISPPEYEAPETRRLAGRITKSIIAILLLQLNSTVHHGILKPLNVDLQVTLPVQLLQASSDGLILFSHTFFGITPHGLYVRQFDDYNHVFAFTYRDRSGQERWLPFVNAEGRLVAPNWGRVQSMWANISVTGHIDPVRFTRAVEKVTAFWGTKMGLDLHAAELTLKMKEIALPTRWERDLRRRNLAGAWRDVGQVTWRNKIMRLETPGMNLQDL
jgi:predicted DCC family thiol-disulfide oxidoreductase YuxK